ncbi:MAG: HD domain-containing protein [Treponema sp.]|nr:HD domain-containing protein [Treponema sp.]
MKIKIDPVLKRFYSHFEKAGYKAYLVGGAVRDIFLHKKPHDFDVATNATPQDVINLFKAVIPTGFEHGTVTVHFEGLEIEVTTFRTEAGYSDGRHPDKVNYAATIEEDLARRDFTMNAIAADLKNGKIVDPFVGRRDIKKRIIKTVGIPSERFLEDGLRPVRAIRFASKLGFSIEKCTFSEIFKKDIQKKTKSISIERFRDEFEKILLSAKPSVGLKLLEETGLLAIFIPEFSVCRGCVQSDQRGFHKFDVLDHLFYACDGAPAEKLNVRLAALFHDIGKPEAKKIAEDENGIQTITFYNHESIGEKITRSTLTRLKFSNSMIDNVCHLVKEHMFHYESNWTKAAVRRFIIRVKPECLEDLYDVRLADMYGMWNEPVDVRFSASIQLLLELKERIQNELENRTVLSLKDLAVNGNDLINAGFEKGKKLGLILNELLDCVIEDPSMNEKETLLNVAKKLNQ